MTEDDWAADVAAIKTIIARQFASLSWTSGTSPDGDGFAAAFLDGATLYPAARPVSPQTVKAFVDRMTRLAGTTLRSLDETVLGTEIIVFGNVAVAVAGCGMIENGAESSQAVEMMLLVKTDGQWRIASQAWDRASEARPIPDRLLSDS